MTTQEKYWGVPRIEPKPGLFHIDKTSVLLLRSHIALMLIASQLLCPVAPISSKFLTIEKIKISSYNVYIQSERFYTNSFDIK